MITLINAYKYLITKDKKKGNSEYFFVCSSVVMESVKKWLNERTVKRNGFYVHYSPPKGKQNQVINFEHILFSFKKCDQNF